MSAGDSLSAIVHFFNDLVGTAVPGFFLLAGLLFLHPFLHSIVVPKDASYWFAISVVVASYAAGHLLTAIQEWCKTFAGACAKRWFAQVEEIQPPIVGLFVKALTHRAEQGVSPSSAQMIDIGKKLAELKPREIRNIAMSVSRNAGDLARRFMFLSLFCTGTGTAFLVLALYAATGYVFFREVLSVASVPCIVFALLWAVVVLASSVLLHRGSTFYRMSQTAPYSVAFADLIMDKSQNEEE